MQKEGSPKGDSSMVVLGVHVVQSTKVLEGNTSSNALQDNVLPAAMPPT